MPWSFPAPYGLQFGINDSAVIAGTMTVAVGSDFETRAFVWTAVSQANGATPAVQLFPAGVTNLSVASGESAMVSMATDINNRCELVGKYGGSG